jgi:sugar lactone lactonase YvrE
VFVDPLDAMQGQLPEGLFLQGQEAYFGLAPLGKIMRADLPGGAVHDFGSIPAPPANGGFLLGITLDAPGNVYVGFGAGPGTAVKNGVYKIPAAGGAVTAPFAQHPEMNFPNGLWLDPSNDIFVADSGGAVFDIKPDGTTTKWASDPSLVGTSMACAHAAPFAIGANGIVRIGNDFYVSNTNLGQIVKIPIQANGSAGLPSVFAGPDCNALGGIDGITVDADGVSILGLVNTQNKLVRIDSTGAVATVYAGKPFDNPASLVLDGKTLYMTNSAFFDMASPMPGLLSISLP